MSNVSLNPYADHMASVRAFCRQQVNSGLLGLEHGTSSPAGALTGPLVDFDSYGDLDQLPPKDVIGPASFTLDIDEHIMRVTVMIGVCTQDDLNSVRLNKAISVLLNSLLPTKEIPVIRENDGEQIAVMKVGQSVRVLPATGKESRNMKLIAVELHSTATLNLS